MLLLEVPLAATTGSSFAVDGAASQCDIVSASCRTSSHRSLLQVKHSASEQVVPKFTVDNEETIAATDAVDDELMRMEAEGLIFNGKEFIKSKTSPGLTDDSKDSSKKVEAIKGAVSDKGDSGKVKINGSTSDTKAVKVTISEGPQQGKKDCASSGCKRKERLLLENDNDNNGNSNNNDNLDDDDDDDAVLEEEDMNNNNDNDVIANDNNDNDLITNDNNDNSDVANLKGENIDNSDSAKYNNEGDKADSCTPMCRWSCDTSACEEECEPQCRPPKCETRCATVELAGCELECEKPECCTVCPKKMPCASDGCPQCETKCGKPLCKLRCPQEQKCSTICESPKCKWDCKKPTSCPKPECKLQCDEPPKECGKRVEESLPELEEGEIKVHSFTAPSSLLQVDAGHRVPAGRSNVQAKAVYLPTRVQSVSDEVIVELRVAGDAK